MQPSPSLQAVCGEFIAIRRDNREHDHFPGSKLWIPENCRRKTGLGTVIGIGKRAKTCLSIGNRVFFSPLDTVSLEIDGEMTHFCRGERGILGFCSA